jgi:UDP-N-acetylmuramyl pentapeptide phosphotransferase/UDP-N-acetylglucosamine-1-phosphate transferase
LVIYVGVPSHLAVGSGVVVALPVPLMGFALVVFLVGVLNIYNFLDGMDGLAGSQAATAGVALFVAFDLRGQDDLALIAIGVAASSAGFLSHNYPPARIFLGDAGSTFLGFTFGALAILGSVRAEGAPFAACPLALAPFLLDGTFTIIRRALRREPIWKAHRTHLYQRAVATGLDHRDVLLRYLVWMAAAGATAILATANTGGLVLGALTASMLACLVGVWVWVARRERRAASTQVALGP